VRKNATALSKIPTWLFSVGPLATDVKDDEEQPIELAEFRDKIGESHHTVFHGALDHSKLDRSDRMTMKSAGAPQGDFRDWDAIAAWVDGIAKSLKSAA
jgi:menaquinone-dependent protoporphyrinogen oxidase